MRTLRPFLEADMDAVLGVWLAASCQTHDFVEPGYWKQHLDTMRDQYLPASEVWVIECDGAVKGFCALHGDSLATLFVVPDDQGTGIGGELMAMAQSQRNRLELTVYRRNSRGVAFYERHGFARVREQVDDATGEPEILMLWLRPAL